MPNRPSRRKALAYFASVFATFHMAAWAGYGFSQTRGADVSGVVLGTRNVPIGLARIELAGPTQAVVMSDAAGRFTVRNIALGDYRVTVRQGGHFQTMVVKISASTLQLHVNW